MKVTAAKGNININRELCKGCQLCVCFCPEGSIHMADTLNASGYQYAVFNDGSKCSGCAICALVCPEVAIEVYRD